METGYYYIPPYIISVFIFKLFINTITGSARQTWVSKQSIFQVYQYNSQFTPNNVLALESIVNTSTGPVELLNYIRRI
jgi:hypothetical protein